MRRYRILSITLAVFLSLAGSSAVVLASQESESSAEVLEETQPDVQEETQNEEKDETGFSNQVTVEGDLVIAEGVYAGKIDLSGMTVDEAKAAVNEYVKERESDTVIVHTDEHKDEVKLKTLGINWSNEGFLDEAANLGKKGNLINRYKEITDVKRDSKVYDVKITAEEKNVDSWVEKTLGEYEQKAVEPSITRSNGSFVVTEGKNGIEIDRAATLEAINVALEEAWTENSKDVDAVFKQEEPKHKAEELKAIKDLMGEKTTTYSTGNVGRTQSLELSTQKLNGTIIYPGEEISVSTLMGPRTIEGGYGTGLGYFGTDVTETVGAGICQTSSTLYNAALYAELEITERSNHSLIVHYVDYGMDSTIYAGNDYKNPSRDLKMRNNYDDPVYIEAYAGGGYCTFKIYGNDTRPENRKVEYIAKTLSESWPQNVTYVDDPSHYEGYTQQLQGAYPAVKATLTKVVYEDGKEVSRELLHTDTYNAAPKKVLRGTKQKETEPPKTTEDSKPETTADSTTKSPKESETKAPATKAETKAPATKAETKAPATKAETKAPETKAKAKAPAE